jgi:hypothetical protein
MKSHGIRPKSAKKEATRKQTRKGRLRKPANATMGAIQRGIQASLRLGGRIPARGPFALEMRMPDWHIDADVALLMPPMPVPPVRVPVSLFPEEAIGRNNGSDVPFKIPAFDHASAPSGGWLGGPLPTGTTGFEGILNTFAVRARNYNSTLYLLRLYHFAYDRQVALDGPGSGVVPNPNGPRRGSSPFPLPPHPSHRMFNTYAREIENLWQRAAQALNEPLEDMDSQTGLMNYYADMIQVNGYIVSMRVVERDRTQHRFGFLEVSGSSSHVSINYPFSSS